jgi:hypothetical protein
MSPFQPTVVRGFSKYVRMTTTSASRVARATSCEPAGVSSAAAGIVDGARPDHDQQRRRRVAAVQEVADGRPRLLHRCSGRSQAERQFSLTARGGTRGTTAVTFGRPPPPPSRVASSLGHR